jgi:Ribbon-helix-helix protein, copG family
MVRTQIQLTEAQAEALKDLAAAQGRSMADLIRRGVDAWLLTSGRVSRGELRKRALAVVGRHRGGPRDLAQRHDQYLEKSARR